MKRHVFLRKGAPELGPLRSDGMGSHNQPTKLAAVSTIPMNSAPTQENRITSLRTDAIVTPPSGLPSPPPHRRRAPWPKSDNQRLNLCIACARFWAACYRTT